MAKYSEQFKLAIVEQYLDGKHGYGSIAAEHALPDSTVRTWVRLYAAHGTDGLVKKFSHYDAEFRLRVLNRMWDEELSYKQVASIYNIRNASCIGHWERCYHDGGLDALIPRKRGRPNAMPKLPPPEPAPPPDAAENTHDEMVAELNQLRMEVAYLKKLQALIQSQQKLRVAQRKKRR